MPGTHAHGCGTSYSSHSQVRLPGRSAASVCGCCTTTRCHYYDLPQVGEAGGGAPSSRCRGMLGVGAAYAEAGIVDLAWTRLVRSGEVF